MDWHKRIKMVFAAVTFLVLMMHAGGGSTPPPIPPLPSNFPCLPSTHRRNKRRVLRCRRCNRHMNKTSNDWDRRCLHLSCAELEFGHANWIRLAHRIEQERFPVCMSAEGEVIF